MKDDRLKSIMSKVFNTKVSEISVLTSQKTHVAWDSLAHLNLIVELEMEFDVDFEPDEISQMNSFEKVKSLLLKKTG